MGVITGKTRQRGIRFLNHIDDWLHDRANRRAENPDHELATEVRTIVHQEYERETGLDAKTGQPRVDDSHPN